MTPVEMLGLTEFPRIGELPYFLTLPGYNFYWFRLQAAPSPITAQRLAETPRPPAEITDTLPAFFMGVAWDTLLDGNVRTLIERESLVPFLQRQRWFGGKARDAPRGAFRRLGHACARAPIPSSSRSSRSTTRTAGASATSCRSPMVAGAEADAILAATPHLALARVTGARKGLVIDGAGRRPLAPGAARRCSTTTQAIRLKRGTVRARRTHAYAELRGPARCRCGVSAAEQSNTSLVFGDRLIVKLFRRVETGPNPDVEIGEHLTTHTAFRRAPQVAAWMEYEAARRGARAPRRRTAVRASQADGWNHALARAGSLLRGSAGAGTAVRGCGASGTPVRSRRRGIPAG